MNPQSLGVLQFNLLWECEIDMELYTFRISGLWRYYIYKYIYIYSRDFKSVLAII